MRELGSGIPYNTHNTTSLIRTLKSVQDILQMEEAFTVKEYTHTHTCYQHGNFQNTEAATGVVLKTQIKVSQNSRENTHARVFF